MDIVNNVESNNNNNNNNVDNDNDKHGLSKSLSSLEKHQQQEEQSRLNTTTTKKQIKQQQKDLCSKLICKHCPWISFTSITSYKNHLQSKKHSRRQSKNNVANTWSCKPCHFNFPNEDEYIKHTNGKRHSIKIKKKTKIIKQQQYPKQSITEPYYECNLKELTQSEFKEEEEDDGEDLYPSLVG
ncbi:hypothetical protein DFA_06589 [Cavenderia fasciculata]|uniref:C2H2-type domain-containing protein n=1 Tax=Cavenderia fasciculata TaxID=261658 RepID=F4PJF3_CACFS|nr:uncharacterized protein DFA_06589 [Cavenderia fasciculata]EGG24439.1 hypothetical protein DFA_06589 [Cavenderia fasciculata]|eukprot:XP_004362290.1 hypothetical protein DFA_06589 [Cavenderia fasciculata]